MYIKLNKRFRREVDRYWSVGAVATPAITLISLDLPSRQLYPSLIALVFAFMGFLILAKTARNIVSVKDHQTIEKFWIGFGVHFHKKEVKKSEIAHLYTIQEKTKHYALYMRLNDGREELLLDGNTKRDFEKGLKDFKQNTTGTTFFNDFRVINKIP